MSWTCEVCNGGPKSGHAPSCPGGPVRARLKAARKPKALDPLALTQLASLDPHAKAELRDLRRVVKAAIAWRKAWGNDPHGHTELDLAAEVDALHQKRRGKA